MPVFQTSIQVKSDGHQEETEHLGSQPVSYPAVLHSTVLARRDGSELGTGNRISIELNDPDGTDHDSVDEDQISQQSGSTISRASDLEILEMSTRLPITDQRQFTPEMHSHSVPEGTILPMRVPSRGRHSRTASMHSGGSDTWIDGVELPRPKSKSSGGTVSRPHSRTTSADFDLQPVVAADFAAAPPVGVHGRSLAEPGSKESQRLLREVLFDWSLVC